VDVGLTGQTILRGRYDGGFDRASLPDDVILTNSFTVRDGRIVTLIITATEPATTPSGGKRLSVLGWVPLGAGVGVVGLWASPKSTVRAASSRECCVNVQLPSAVSGAALHRSSRSLGSGEDLSPFWRPLAADRPPVPLTRRQ
jgi:hypothetical protein